MTIATSIEATGNLSVIIGAGGAGTAPGAITGSLGSSSYISGKLEAWGGGRIFANNTDVGYWRSGAGSGYLTTQNEGGDITSRIQFFYPGANVGGSQPSDPVTVGGGGTGFSGLGAEPGRSTIGLPGGTAGPAGQPGGATVAADATPSGWGGNGGKGICLIFWTE
jgi:hypothetical protein